MNNACTFNLRLSAISVGVIALFAAGVALADDQEIKALTQPQSTVQVEMIGVDTNSAKFGEYNGLYGHPSGAYPNGGFNVRGGSAYTNNEQGDTTRYSITGENLGLTSRSANASIADQGSWSVGINFDQLQHNITNSYQTPYNGSVGGQSFLLPSTLQGQNKVTNSVTGLSNMPISTTRNNTTLSGTAVIDKNSNITFEYNNLLQDGAKLGAFAGAGVGSQGIAESISILPNPTKYQTDTVNLAYNWKGDTSHFTASYFGSFFQNAYNGVNWQAFNISAATTQTMQTMSTAPNNAFNQVNLAGGYDFTKTTKLTSNFSMGQNTQNQGFAGSYDAMMTPSGVPTASMNGLVNTLHADAKVTDRSVQDLTLGALVKFDNRDNLTQSNMYQMTPIHTDEKASVPNTPMSFKQLQLALSGDYKISKDQRMGLNYQNNSVNRWCNQYGSPGTTQANIGAGNTTTTWNSFYNSSSCVSATSSNENKVDANYKLNISEDLKMKAGVGYANRKTQWDQSAIVAMPWKTSAIAPGGTSGSVPAGYNSGNWVGFYPFFEASRNQYIGKASADWQATEDLTFTLGGKYTNDLYPDSKYGVQNGNSWSLNLDGAYKYAEAGTITAFATQQIMGRNLTNLNTYLNTSAQTGAQAWNNTLKTSTTTVGVGLKQGDLVGGKLTLLADALVSLANSQYSTNVNYNTGTACNAPTTQTCGILPGIQNNLGMIKLGGIYQLDKNSKIGLQYWYQHLYSNDYYYNGYQSGYSPTGVMPTNQNSGSYNVNVISANYTYTFD